MAPGGIVNPKWVVSDRLPRRIKIDKGVGTSGKRRGADSGREVPVRVEDGETVPRPDIGVNEALEER